MRRRARRRGFAQEIAELHAALDQLAGRDAEPLAQRLVDEQESSRAVDRIEADRRVIEEIGELGALVADLLLHRVALGHVLEAPQAHAGAGRDPMRRDAEPGDRPRRMRDRHSATGAALALKIAAQRREVRAAFASGESPRQGIERRPGQPGKAALEGGVDVGGLAAVAGDEMRVGRGLERLAEKVEPPDHGAVNLAPDHGGDAEQRAPAWPARPRRASRSASAPIWAKSSPTQPTAAAPSSTVRSPSPRDPARRAQRLGRRARRDPSSWLGVERHVHRPSRLSQARGATCGRILPFKRKT